MTLFRGSGGDLPLMPWLEERIWPVEAKLEAEDVYWGTRLACAGDDPHRHDPLLGHVLAAGGDRAGGRRRRAAGDDRRAALRQRRATPRRMRADGARAASRRWPRSAARSPPALAPHSIYTVSEESLRFIAELSAETRGVPIQIHLSETEPEVDGLRRRARPAPRRLPRPARPADRAHPARPRRLARRRGAGADRRARRAPSSPTRSANMKLAVGGVFPYPAARAAGVAVGLGTDGAGSNDSLDLLADLKALRAGPEPRRRRRDRDRRSPTPGRSPPAPRRRCSARTPLDGRRAPPTSSCSTRRPRAGDRRPHRRPRLRRRPPRRHHRRRRPVLMRGGEQPERDEIVAQAAERAARLGL